MSPKAKPAKGTVKGSRLLVVAEARLVDMNVLFSKQRFNAAVYMGGYVVECVLKWAITKVMHVERLPAEFEHHNLDVLLAKAFPPNPRSALPNSHRAFAEIADGWAPALRYESAPKPKASAKNFCDLVQLVYDEVKERLS